MRSANARRAHTQQLSVIEQTSLSIHTGTFIDAARLDYAGLNFAAKTRCAKTRLFLRKLGR